MLFYPGRPEQIHTNPFVEMSFIPSEWTPVSATPGGASPIVWYRADSINQSDSTAVATWSDSSGNGIDATQGTEAARPTFRTSIRNGLPVVRFDGGDGLRQTGFQMDLRQHTFFIVAEQTGAGNSDGILSITPTSGNDYNSTTGIAFEVSTTTFRPTFLGSTSNTYHLQPTGTPTMVPFAAWCERKSIGGTGRLYQNGGTAVASDSTYTEFASASGSGLLIGARYLSGAVDLTFGLIGDICEILVYSQELSVADTNQVGRYLQRWGLTWTDIST